MTMNDPTMFDGRTATLILLAVLMAACADDRAPSPAEASADGPVSTEEAPPPGRLGDQVRPTAYHLDLRLDPREDGFSGSVAIDLQLARPSPVIWLHGLDLRVASVTAMTPTGAPLAGSYEQVLDSGVSAVRFDRPLPAGAVRLRLEYSADYNRNLAGLFKVEEQGDAYVLAKSESIQARRFLPGFDEPGLKAVYQLRLTVPEGNRVITNTPETGRQPAGDGMVTVSFAPTRPMSTYLLSLAVGPFDVVERPPLPPNAWRERAIPLRGFARRGRGGDMNYILDITPGMVEAFESQLQQPYPYAKLDIVAAPQWPSGATELSAAITYREQAVLVGDEPPPGARLRLVNVHAHEIAHMWFGNLVTPPWWDDLWLKEGFATWGTPLAMTLLEPEAGHEVTAAARAIDAMRLDSLASTRAIREPIADNSEVRNAYDAITYSKSLGVIRMVDDYFGPQVFRPALGRYIDAFVDGQADSPVFYEVIGRETETPALAETFRSFVEQKGVPLVRTELECEGGISRVRLQQQRYRPLGSEIAATGQQWTIPLCLRDATGARHCTMLREPAGTIELGEGACPDWLMPNAGGVGYYRWSLPTAQWVRLLEAFDTLDDMEALSLVDSAVAAFEAGELPPELLLAVVQRSARHARREVVTAPLAALARYLEHYLDAGARAALVDRLGPAYAARLARALASREPGEQLLAAQLQGFMARSLRMPGPRDDLTRRAVAFTGFEGARDADALSSDLYVAALSVAVQDLGVAFTRHLLALRQTLDDPQFEGASAVALGAATDPESVGLVQEQLLGDGFGSREVFDLLHEAMATGPVAATHWQWIADNFPALVEKVPAQWRRRLPQLGDAFCDNAGAGDFESLFTEQAELLPGYRRAFEQTRETIALCRALAPQGAALATELVSGTEVAPD